MTVEDYRLYQRRIGTSRVVVVQPKFYGTDNSCLLDAMKRFGGNARGVAVVHPGITEAGLERLHAAGVRALRFSLWNPADLVTTAEMIEPLADRIAGRGWHVQLHMLGEQIAAHAALIRRLPCPVVFDHMGRLPPAEGPDHAAFAIIADLLREGRAWLKLSGAYLNTAEGPPHYADATRMAKAYVATAPERLVWGSDWPHVTEQHKPDDALLFDLLADWAGDEALRRRILVDNPAALYGFT
jgi:predicted TIM-barrel fold metal-dependent hydrolase